MGKWTHLSNQRINNYSIISIHNNVLKFTGRESDLPKKQYFRKNLYDIKIRVYSEPWKVLKLTILPGTVYIIFVMRQL